MGAAEVEYCAEMMSEGFYLIPRHMHDGVKHWVLDGIPPGSFLTAVLSNDLAESFGCADEDNRAAMFGWVCFLHNYVPAQCRGSAVKVRSWAARGGVRGAMLAGEAVA